MKLKLQFIIAIFIALVVYIPAVQAQANLTFSRGNNGELTITLLNPVTYNISNNACSEGASTGPLFTFDEAGNPFAGTLRNFTGNITYSVNGGAAQSITRGNSGTSSTGGSPGSPDRTPLDIFVTGSILQDIFASDRVVVLSAGTITTTTAVPGATPANGSYTTFITSNTGVRCSLNGVSTGTTAATVSVSGRVTTASGRGIVNVRLSLTDSSGQTRTATSTAFGHYRFDDVEVGETYILSAAAKRYTFSQPVQVLNINEAIDAVNFIADSIYSARDF